MEREIIQSNQEVDSFLTSTVSVVNIIPDINMEGMTLKDDMDKTGSRFADENPAREIKSLPSGLATSFASKLFVRDAVVENLSPGDVELRKMKERIAEVFDGQIVVDIAAGDNTFAYRIVDAANARAYVGVEPAFAADLKTAIYILKHVEHEGRFLLSSEVADIQEFNQNGNNIPAAIVQDDMLSFLRRLPDASVSVWCSGVDVLVLPSGDYRAEVAKEIVRVLSPEGAYVGQSDGMSIDIPDEMLDKEVLGDTDKKYSSVAIFTKK